LAGLRRRFSHGSDDATALDRALEVPDSPSRLRTLAEVIDRHVGVDAGFGDELQKIVEEARAGGVDVASVTQVAWGNQNVQAQGVVGSTFTVSYGAQQAPPRSYGAQQAPPRY
jgi:hypothetical protein